MTNKLRHLRSGTAEKVPTPAQMDVGQFAINTNDGKVFIKKDDNTVKDITDNIFRNDTSVVVTDSPTSDVGAITSTVDSVNVSTLKKTQIELKEKVHIENEKELRFYENSIEGVDYVSFKAPNDLTETYTLNWPLQDAIKTGQLLGNDTNGQLKWYDADTFGGNRIYVSAEKGDDANDGVNAPVRTIKRALQLASEKVYDVLGNPNGSRWNVSVAAGEYYELNPIIVPDNVSVIGDGLRACLLRPKNPNKDMLRVRNGCYFTEFTFRDALTGAPTNPSPTGSPIYTFDYAVAFDDPLDTTVDRTGYTNLPSTKPLITTSPYIQNCSIISFLGGNGCLVDGSKVVTPNTPLNQLEAETPQSGPAPEQGKSMVANAFTMLSFGGTGWRVINDAYVQIVSCFQIFMLNGTYTQSGGYCSVTNSATNFGLYALRSSGFSPNAFAFDKGYVATTGTNNGKQTLTAFGWSRPEGPVNEFIVRIYNPTTNADLTDSTYKLTSPGFAEVSFNAATAINTTTDVFNVPAHGLVTGNQITYLNNGGTTIGGLFNGDSYFAQVIDTDNFRLAFDDSGTRLVDLTSAGVGTHTFRRNSYEMIVNEILETHNTFQTLTLSTNTQNFNPGDLITGDDTAPPGNPHSAYVYSWNSTTSELVVVVNKVTVGITEQRVQFNSTSRITSLNGVVLGSPITLTGVASKIDLWAATFEIIPTITGGQFTNLATLPGKKVWFHRPSITNSSAHTWEYAGSGIDYNALPQNGGRGNPIYEQYSELAGQVYTSGTNELGDFKVGDFIKAFNRTGNVIFTNKVSIDQLDVLRLALSDVEITAISTDPDLGENEPGGPLDSRLTTQKAIWSYANNRLGPFIDKSVSTNAVPGNIVQLNANGQINRDLIPSQRNFNSFTTLGFGTRVTLSENIPVDDSQSGDICTERYSQVALTLDNPVTVTKGWLVTQASSGAKGYIKEDVISDNAIVVASEYGDFETPNFDAVGVLVINGDATPGDGNVAVIPVVVGPVITDSTSNYFISSSTDSQYLIVGNTSSFTYTNASVSTAVRYNNRIYVETTLAHSLLSGNRVKLDLTDDDFDKVEYASVYDTTRFSMAGSGSDSTVTGSTTSTSTIVGITGTSTTGSCSDAGLTGTINVGDWVFGGGLPLGSRITAVDLSGDPNTFTITFPSSTTVASTSTAALIFISPISRTGTVKTVITAADSLASGAFDEVRTGVLTSVNNLSFANGSNYTPASGTTTYLRVPLTNVSGTGTGASANITVANGSVTDVDIFRGGTGYQIGDILSASNLNIGGTGSGFQIAVTGVEQRVYLDIVGGQLFVATSGAVDFIEDNNSPSSTITATDSTTKTFNALPVGSGGNVDYTLNRITITSHGFNNGDPVAYDPAPNVAMGGLTTGNVYYVKLIDVNTIELYEEYSLTSQMSFGTSSTGTHNLIRYAVNLIDNSFYVPAHGFATGDAVRITGSDLPSYTTSSTVQIADNSYFFVGSITTNSFTLHELRSDALASVNGITSVPYNITATGSGSIKFIDNDITITGVVNTSSQYLDNWSVLVADNIDASNIVSGVISTSRLGLGSAESGSFLRGDSEWKPVVQVLRYPDAGVSDNIQSGALISLVGDVNPTNFGFYENTTAYNANDKAGSVTIDIQRVNQQSGENFSTLGVASFLKDHFVVGNSGDSGYVNGQVSIRTFAQNGTVDAATLQTYTPTQLRDSTTHTTQPVNLGGTGITVYTTGDTLYATGSTTLAKLPIDSENTILTSSGSAPQWSASLTVPRNISIASGELATSSITSSLFNSNALDLRIGGASNSVTIGSTGASQTLTTNVGSYTTGGSSSVSVVANITSSVTIATINSVTNPGLSFIDLVNTTGVRVGQLVSGSAGIPAGTQVVGGNSTRIYLSNATIGTIAGSTNITFTDTATSLGLKLGDQITIAGESTGNLNGTWPVTVAGTASSTFTFITNGAVTLTNAARVGTIVKTSSLLIRNRNVIIGSSEASGAPVPAFIRAENGVGTNIGGAALTLRGGLATGSALGGSIIFNTATIGTTGTVRQTDIARMAVAPSANATTLDLITAMTTANVFVSPTTVSAFTGATNLTLGATSGTLNLRNATITAGNATTVNIDGANPTISSTSTGTLTLFNTAITAVNAFGVATGVNIATGATSTINLGNTSSTTRVGVLNVQNQAYTNTNSVAGITSAAAVVVDSFPLDTYRSGEYTMQITCTAGTDVNSYQISKALVIHYTTDSILTEYGLIKTGTNELATFTTAINGANVEVRAQASAGNTITVKLVKTLQVL